MISYEQYKCEHCKSTINLLECSEDFWIDQEGNKILTDFKCPECGNYVEGEAIYV